MSQPWNPNVSPKGRVLGTYGGLAATAGFVIVMETPWPWKLVAAIPIAGSVMLGVAGWRAGQAVVRSWTEGENLVADSGSSSSLGSKDRFPRRLAQLTAVFACWAFVVMSVIASFDYFQSHRSLHEHATVVAEHPVPSSACLSGHALKAQYSVTWRSEDPPSGLPAVFVQNDACKLYSVGHSDIVVRHPEADGSVRTDVSPFDSVTDELMVIAGGTLLSLPVGYLWAIWRISKKPRATLDRSSPPSS